ncbi:mono/diheme cytochrome c family protein [Robbsia andropogonis]|uniref:c-type cytochrome n=2 Tax=Robbsia andropogonis TaxID=28092 RepID=UPI003D24282F
MKKKMKVSTHRAAWQRPAVRALSAGVVVGAFGLSAWFHAAAAVAAPDTPASSTAAASAQPASGVSVSDAAIQRGAYLARVGDCVACHTAAPSGKNPAGQPFAGGLAIKSPLGTIYSTNITPDPQHGIGNYTEAQFAAALRDGKRADGTNLYPAMPYPSYSKLTDSDVHDLYVYFMKGVKPVDTTPPQTALSFPFNLRFGLSLWNWAFTQPGVFKPDTKLSADQNRGAYLVEGLGHCGSCHTARGVAMQEKALDGTGADYLGGATLNGWWAPQLRANGQAGGVASWNADEVVDYLSSGRNVHTTVGGEMKSVVEHSTSHMTDADLHAIAEYLKTLSVNQATATPAIDDAARAATQAHLTAAKQLSLGERLYLDNCAGCHTVTGNGAARVFPATAGNSMVNAKDPTGLIETILRGAEAPSTAKSPERLPMPAFANRMNDDEVAQLATFVRSGWGNKGGSVSASQVAKVRAQLSTDAKE